MLMCIIAFGQPTPSCLTQVLAFKQRVDLLLKKTGKLILDLATSTAFINAVSSAGNPALVRCHGC